MTFYRPTIINAEKSCNIRSKKLNKIIFSNSVYLYRIIYLKNILKIDIKLRFKINRKVRKNIKAYLSSCVCNYIRLG